MRRGALLNDAQLSGMLPGSVMLFGFLALIAPCGGSFGLPKVISLFTGVAASAVVIVAAVTSPPAAVAANMSRLENISTPRVSMNLNNSDVAASLSRAIKSRFGGLIHSYARHRTGTD